MLLMLFCDMKEMRSYFGALTLAAVVLASRSSPAQSLTNAPATASVSPTSTNAAMEKFQKPSETELRKKLTRAQFEVTQHAATEPSFQNEFWNNHKPGIYVDIVSGQPLFSSLDKFDSGCGWPSFSRPLAEKDVVNRDDSSHGMERSEEHTSELQSHSDLVCRL